MGRRLNVDDIVPSEELRAVMLRFYATSAEADFDALREMFSGGAQRARRPAGHAPRRARKSRRAYHSIPAGAHVMTHLLEQALSAVAKLPPSEQDALAAIVLDELAAEERWGALFAKSQDTLADLAQEALAEHRAGKSQAL